VRERPDEHAAQSLPYVSTWEGADLTRAARLPWKDAEIAAKVKAQVRSRAYPRNAPKRRNAQGAQKAPVYSMIAADAVVQ
jgi:hypothetical protein